VKRIGGTGSELVYDMGFDKSGNIYILGTFHGELRVGKFKSTSKGSYNNLFITKLDSKGEVIWLDTFHTGSQISGGDGNISAGGIALYDQYVYITGGYIGKLVIGATSKQSNNDSSDMFLIKMSQDGRRVSFDSYGGGSWDNGNHILVLESGNISSLYLVGQTFGKIDTKNLKVDTKWKTTTFVAKMDGNCTISRVSAMGGDDFIIYDATVSKWGDVFLCGRYSDKVYLPATSGPKEFVSNKGSSNGIVIQLNSANFIHHGISFGGSNGAFCQGIAANDVGDDYITGSYYENAIFGKEQIFSRNSKQNLFAAELTHDTARWVSTAGNVTESSWTAGRKIALDKDNNIYIAGEYGGKAEMGSEEISTIKDFESLIIKMNKYGEKEWITSTSSSINSGPFDIKFNRYKDEMVLVGSFTGHLKIAGEVLQSSGNDSDIFLWSFK